MQRLKEGVYWNGKRIIYPIKKDMDKPLKGDNIDWKNMWGVRNSGVLVLSILLILLVLFGSWAYRHDTEECFKVIENPCDYCSEMFRPVSNFDNQLEIPKIEVDINEKER